MTTETDNGTAFNRAKPVNHLGLSDINNLARLFSGDKKHQGTDVERGLMSRSGSDIEAVRARALGLNKFVGRLLDRRDDLLRSPEWPEVLSRITSKPRREALSETGRKLTAAYYELLDQALRMAESFRREIQLRDLSQSIENLTAHADWTAALELIVGAKHRRVLGEPVRLSGSQAYVALVTEAVKAGERALDRVQRASAPVGGGQPATAAGATRKRIKHAAARGKRVNGPLKQKAPAAPPAKDKAKNKKQTAGTGPR